MKVEAFRGATHVNFKDTIRSFKWTLDAYSHINELIEYMNYFPRNIDNDLKHIGQFFNNPLEESYFEESKKKKVSFLCNQLTLHGKKLHGLTRYYEHFNITMR